VIELSERKIFDEKRISEIVEMLDFTKANGLITVVTQDYKTNEILMVAYANEEAVHETLATGKAHYWSRSRKTLWEKGGHSGHFQYIKEIFVDCDADCLIYKVEQVKAACHTGYYSCFYRKIEKDGITIIGKQIFDPKSVY